jgi:hypothetical protein
MQVIVDRLSKQTLTRDANNLFQNLSILKEDEKQCSKIKEKAAKGQIIQPPAIIICHLERKNMSVFYILNDHHYPLKFKRS